MIYFDVTYNYKNFYPQNSLQIYIYFNNCYFDKCHQLNFKSFNEIILIIMYIRYLVIILGTANVKKININQENKY